MSRRKKKRNDPWNDWTLPLFSCSNFIQYNSLNNIKHLTEQNFQEFLENNLKQMFVYETPEYEYQYYFPTIETITSNGIGNGKYKRQA
jgi:hypothetical protein